MIVGRARTAFALATLALATTAGISQAHELGHTTEQHTIASGPPIAPGSDFNTLVEGPGAPRVVRTLSTARRWPVVRAAAARSRTSPN